MKKKCIEIILLLLLTIKFYGNSSFPEIKFGMLDLSSLDISQNQPIKLDGQWEFYPDQFLDPGNNTAYPAPSYINVPMVWNKYRRSLGFSPYGYGTYRLQVRISKTIKDVSLYFHYIYTAYRVYVNGQEILSVGEPGVDKASTTPQFKVYHTVFENNQTINDIVIHLSNYHHSRGGITTSIRLGSHHSVVDFRENNLVLDFIILGGLFFLGLYHLYFFLIHKQGRFTLYFVMVCLLACLRTIIIGEVYIKELFPGLPWIALLKMEYLCNYLTIIAFNGFFASFFSKQYSRMFSNILIGVTSVICIVNLFLSGMYMSSMVIIMHFLSAVTISYAAYMLISESFKKNKEAFIFLMGFIGIIITFVYDVFRYNLNLYGRDYLGLGILGLLFVQSYLISRRFKKVFLQAEHLSVNLKQEVEDSTEELKKQNKRQIDFFINFAHETKTPLTLISNYLDSYIEEVKKDFKLEIISNNIHKLKRDMCNLLDFEKLEKKQEYYNHDSIINISEIIKDKILLFQKVAVQKNQHLVGQIQDEIYIKADVFAFERIVNNLIDNAIKYTPEEGSIGINLDTIDDTVNFVVEDSGIGISQSQLELIFKPYHQIKHKKRNYQGIGLGLNIVNNIVTSLGGKIKVTSQVGEGSRFSIFLPLASDTDNALINELEVSPNFSDYSIDIKSLVANEKKLPQFTEEYDKNKQSILIVDDNYAIIQLFKIKLKGLYNIFFALNGREALELLDRIPLPDIIITDIMMDEMDGYEFLLQLNNHKRFALIPVLIVSAKISLQDKLEGLNLGALNYIEKPFDIEDVKERIASVIKQKNKISKAFLSRSRHALDAGLNSQVCTEKENFKSHQENILTHGLTERESEIVFHLEKGLLYKEVALKLSISEKTVRNHMNSVYRKTKTSNIMQLMNLLSEKKIYEI